VNLVPLRDPRASTPCVLRLGRAPLVGRQRELAALDLTLAEARAGRSTVVLLAGEPGIGKSRLLDEFPPSGHSGTSIVLRGGASQAEGMPPYLPLLEALGEYVALAPSDELRHALGSDAAVLARLLPEIAARLGESIDPPYPISPEQERLRLYEVVATLLGHIASARGPLVLALDDLQWADAATCELLLYVVPRLAARAAPILFLGAYRDSESSDNQPLGRLITELNRRRLLLPLPLPRLEPLESRQLGVGLIHGDVAEDVTTLIHHQGEGNPFFEEELLRALVDERRLVQRDGRWRLEGLNRSLLPRGIALLPRPVHRVASRVRRRAGRHATPGDGRPTVDDRLDRQGPRRGGSLGRVRRCARELFRVGDVGRRPSRARHPVRLRLRPARARIPPTRRAGARRRHLPEAAPVPWAGSVPAGGSSARRRGGESWRSRGGASPPERSRGRRATRGHAAGARATVLQRAALVGQHDRHAGSADSARV